MYSRVQYMIREFYDFYMGKFKHIQLQYMQPTQAVHMLFPTPRDH